MSSDIPLQIASGLGKSHECIHIACDAVAQSVALQQYASIPDDLAALMRHVKVRLILELGVSSEEHGHSASWAVAKVDQFVIWVLLQRARQVARRESDAD